MLFFLFAKDGTDSEALQRRLAAREAHISMGDAAVARGEQILGAALLNESEQMCGSAMLVDFESREALDVWLEKEPYITGDVWKNIEIFPCKIGPSFQHVLKGTK